MCKLPDCKSSVDRVTTEERSINNFENDSVVQFLKKLVAKFLRAADQSIPDNPTTSRRSGFNPVRRLVVDPWFIDSVEFMPESGQVRISGWALPDPDTPESEWSKRFLVNGRIPAMVTYPLTRPDIQEFFAQRQDAARAGFVLVAAAEFPEGIMQVSCMDTACNRLDAARQHWSIPDASLHTNLPDADRRFRVIGNRDPEGFLRVGATDALRIRAAYEAVSGKPWGSLEAALDWGVGCGRLARHLALSLGSRFHGCDIDADNVAWCSANLPGVYAPSRLDGKLPYPDNSFDLIYGVSVFTHLRQKWESHWLQELHRVLRPGGILLVTTHGQTAIDCAQLDAATYANLQQRVEDEGLVVTGTNNQLDGFVEHPQEYVNVFHSSSHIQSAWGRWFRHIRQLKGYIYTHDLIAAVK